uniref:Serpin domain-containing protein n=1 Tax=Dendroctonus ponderosae TaxID=77166 RepID=A0AAR5PQK5_DENPD
MRVFTHTLLIVLCGFGSGKCQFFRNMIDLVDPFHLLHSRQEASTPAPPSLEPVVKPVEVEKAIFQISGKLQALLGTDNNQVIENYLISPICAINLLGQFLLGNRGNASQHLENLLGLSPKPKVAKREVNVVELTSDHLYNEKVYHPVFHWRVRKRSSQLSRPNPHYQVSIRNALVYQRNFDLSAYWKSNAADFYKTLLITSDNTSALLEWRNFGTRTNLLIENLQNQALQLSRFQIETKFNAHFTEEETEDVFRVSRYERSRVKYMQGLIRNTLFMNTPDFTLTVIPLQGQALHMYIMLPRNDIYNIHHFSESIEDFQTFKAIQEEHKYNFLDLKIRLPNIFNCTEELDVLKGLRSRSANLEGSFNLNRVAHDLKLTHAVQQLQISISSKDAQEKMGQEETAENPVPLVNLQVTTPFLFFIMQEKHKIVLLWGSISDPSQLVHRTLRP